MTALARDAVGKARVFRYAGGWNYVCRIGRPAHCGPCGMPGECAIRFATQLEAFQACCDHISTEHGEGD